MKTFKRQPKAFKETGRYYIRVKNSHAGTETLISLPSTVWSQKQVIMWYRENCYALRIPNERIKFE